MTYILGITSILSENPAAALLKDGKLIVAVEEERFNRVKNSRGIPFPGKSIKFCLDYAGITLKDVTKIGVGWSSPYNQFLKETSLAVKRPAQFIHLFRWIRDYQKQNTYSFFKNNKISYNLHHLAHASSAFHVSGFNNANIISMDGRGETTSTLLGVGKNKKNIKIIKEFNLLNSVGALYEAFTDYLGFIRHSQEGKVMGLASYGKPIYDTRNIVRFTKNGYSMETFSRYMFSLENFVRKIKGEKINSLNGLLVKNFGPKRTKDEPLTKRHENLAATVQHVQEKILVKLARFLYEKNGLKNFCLAGGSSLNCVANGLLLEQDFVKDIFIQPASSDSGGAIGAAYLEWIKLTNKKSDFKMEHGYWGPEYTDEEIEKVLKENKIKYKYYKDIEGIAAELIAKGNIIGWHQGRMEIGPRALGNRSILADPTDEKMKDKVNMQVKHRENWRPFAPSLLLESAKKYLENPYPSPFMILSSRIKKERWKEIPSVVHIDGTTRPQTVRKKDNPKYHKLIKEFEKIKGTPVLLNTSFNDRGEPIVCSPKDSLSSFKRTNLDYLAIGNFLIKKQ